jgi:hypothetical protein
MQHCAGNSRFYARRIACGTLYFYRMLEPERLTIVIRPAGGGWMVEEVRGPCNRMPSDHANWLIWNWVRQSQA